MFGPKAKHRFHIQDPIQKVGDDAYGDHVPRNIGKRAAEATSVDGESFADCLDDGCRTEAMDLSMKRRGLKYIDQRRAQIGTMFPDDYDDYEGRETVNLS